jgi:hypothetical protein
VDGKREKKKKEAAQQIKMPVTRQFTGSWTALLGYRSVTA